MTGRYFIDYNVGYSIIQYCNYNCLYCTTKHNKSINSKVPVEKILNTLKRTKKKWTIGLTGGGEPFLCKDIVEVCAKITKEFNLTVDTNLSINSRVRDFAKNIDPKRVHYIYASAHIEEREKRKGVKDFLENISLLKEKYFNVVVNYVLHPTLINRFMEDYEFFKLRGIELEAKPFCGIYNGRAYPLSYTYSERKIIFTHNPYAVFYPLHFMGIKCNAGKSSIILNDNGIFSRCGSDMRSILGNVDTGIKLYDTAKPCRVYNCQCKGLKLIEKTERYIKWMYSPKNFLCGIAYNSFFYPKLSKTYHSLRSLVHLCHF